MRTTPRGVVHEKYLDNWVKSGRLRRWAYVVTTLFTVGTFANIVRDVLGFSDRLLSMGSAVSVAVVFVAVIVLRWTILRWAAGPDGAAFRDTRSRTRTGERETE